MLRPERMSKVSVTGSKGVMDDVIETVHDLHLVHFTDYDGRWDGFDNGDPLEGGDEASEKLVTVRALKSILGVEEDDAGPSRIITDETVEEELERVRTEANDLDDRRTEIEGELREVDERVESMAPFAALGIDLDLLWGYDSLAVAVGEGNADSVERALADLDAPTEVFSADGVVAAFAHTDEDSLQEALVEATFTAIDVPHEEGDPEEYLAELEHREQQLESKLATVENQIEELRYDVAGFLLAAEEKLAIEARKAEAPLSFATTRNAFVAEGWIPTERVAEFEAALADAVDDHAEVEELEVASYTRHGHADHTEEVGQEEGPGVPDDPGPTPGAAAESAESAEGAGSPGARTGESADADDAETAETTQDARADGGVVTMADDDPPVIQDNPRITQPFELLTKAVGRPNYSELDPTIVLFLTFPLMFGFIIGDVGYGLVYTGIGYWMVKNFDSDAMKNFGVITAAAGLMTTLFGVLYGEIFGLHLVSEHFWDGLLGMGHPPIEKGLSPASSEWAYAWFVITVLFGVVHMNVAYAFEFFENYSLHGFRDALTESGSWLFALNGLWLFVFSRPPTGVEGGETVFQGPKPPFIYNVFDGGEAAAMNLGFSGVPSPFAVSTPIGTIPLAEFVGVAMVVAGLVLLALGPAAELVEFHQVLAHALSYLRIAAVLLAKAGMAFAVNLLFFGAYETEGEYHFMLDHGPEWVADHYGESAIMFDGMMHGGPAMLVFGILVLIVGHLVVLILGVTSSGIQSVRLEYFEFFSKFYEGNGTAYAPFGSEREFTTEE